MKPLAIVHPRSRRQARWLEVQKLLKAAGVEVEIHLSEWPGHARVLAQQHVHSERLNISVGGDGTMNEILNGWKEQASQTAPVFATVPGGTGNDFARSLGLDLAPERLASAIVEPRPQTFDLGLARTGSEKRYFLVGATGGFSAEVTRRVHALPRVAPGTALYLFSLLTSLLSWRNRTASLEIDGRRLQSHNFFNLNLANVRHYGGGMVSAPRAHPADGRLDMVLMELSLPEVVRALPENYLGRFHRVPGVRQRSFRRARLETLPPSPIQCDGEMLGVTPLEVELDPDGVLLSV